jgi:hypothetical protein
MSTHIGVLSISLLLLALVVRGSLATPLTVVGLMGLVLLRLFATSGIWVARRSVVRPASRGRHAQENTLGRKGGGP